MDEGRFMAVDARKHALDEDGLHLRQSGIRLGDRDGDVEVEYTVMGQNGNMPLVFFSNHLNAPDAEAVVVLIALGCSGQTVGKIQLTLIVN